MSVTTGRIGPLLAAGATVLLLALGVVACGGGDSTDPATVTTTAAVGDGRPAAGTTQFDPRAIYAEAAPSVVTIISFVGDASSPSAAGQGSGFVISDAGEIVTNAHVVTDATEVGGADPINEADEVYVEFGDRNQVPAEIVG
ncbi:MAG: trypsin-like peptidase domain-containing protein, partial [Thermoleophilia bacterium]|nr:trypsin-like peptidase domain-containing protein [Thermoleophilia bacterium]